MLIILLVLNGSRVKLSGVGVLLFAVKFYETLPKRLNPKENEVGIHSISCRWGTVRHIALCLAVDFSKCLIYHKFPFISKCSLALDAS